MNITIVKLSQIKPYDKNPRKNERAVKAVAESIRQFGFRQPIVVDLNNVIICGHTRWFAAHSLGMEEVPVHVADNLTEQQIIAYRIADNKTAELASWDNELLSLELSKINEINMKELGFSEAEYDKLIGEIGEEQIPDLKPIRADGMIVTCPHCNNTFEYLFEGE